VEKGSKICPPCVVAATVSLAKSIACNEKECDRSKLQKIETVTPKEGTEITIAKAKEIVSTLKDIAETNVHKEAFDWILKILEEGKFE